jgi:hypothetical protein
VPLAEDADETLRVGLAFAQAPESPSRDALTSPQGRVRPGRLEAQVQGVRASRVNVESRRRAAPRASFVEGRSQARRALTVSRETWG